MSNDSSRRITIPEEMAIITCLFTPQPHDRRRRNFELFRAQFGNGLYVAELSFDERPHLTREDARTYHFHGASKNVLWQKERLLNEIVRRLPRSVTVVAWIDADVLFVDRQWPIRAIESLIRVPVVQLFETVVHLDAEQFPMSQSDGSVSAATRYGPSAYGDRSGATGFAWAARRAVLDDATFLDCMVLGGADTFMACAFSGVAPTAIFAQLSPKLGEAITRWSDRVHKNIGGRVGFLKGTIEHLFHGRLSARGYFQRYEILRKSGFNPDSDLFLEESGLYAWRAPNMELPTRVAEYFERRSQTDNM